MEQTIVLTIIGLIIYFIPSFIAHLRGNKNLAAILILNVFLGWTGLGWVGALIWASLNDDKA
jgi:hypothetical protein